ncbi:MAG: single-stranded DNA-binding protein [Solobacterium sp.]|nr:single-stranded DNA-binding protein [Solobacterium sp.]
MNECVVVGKVMELPEIKKTAKGNTVATILLECEKNFRDEDGMVGTDIFSVTVWRGEAETAREVLKPGSMVAIRGRMNGRSVFKDGKTYRFVELVAEHIDYLRGLSA